MGASTTASYTADAKHLRQLQQENARLKKLVAERDLEIEVMKEIAAKKVVPTPVLRKQALFVHRRSVRSERACALVRVAWLSLRYDCA